jgi:hypothetical protein
MKRHGGFEACISSPGITGTHQMQHFRYYRVLLCMSAPTLGYLASMSLLSRPRLSGMYKKFKEHTGMLLIRTVFMSAFYFSFVSFVNPLHLF